MLHTYDFQLGEEPTEDIFSVRYKADCKRADSFDSLQKNNRTESANQLKPIPKFHG
jgi:hypothetical protein